MLELGAAAAAEHRGLGRVAARTEPSLLLAVGAFAERVAEGAREGGLGTSAVVTAPDAEAAARLLNGWLRPGDLLLAVGAYAGEIAAGARAAGLPDAATVTAPDAAAAGAALAAWVRPGDRILLKGSRGVRLEGAIERLRASGKIRDEAAAPAAGGGAG